MNNPKFLILFISSFIVLAIAMFPRIFLRNYPKVTSEEISKIHPELRSIKFKYNVIPIVILPTILILYFVAFIMSHNLFFFPWFVIIPIGLFTALYDGFFALLTGVFSMTTRCNLNLFVYDHDKRYRWLAQLQISLAILGSMITISIFLLWK